MISILLVDSESEICSEISRVLQQCGLHVQTANSLEKALQLAQQSPYDAILVEFNLRSESKDSTSAGMGLELICRLRASGTKAALVVFTAMEGEVYETMSREAGADDFIQKVAGITHLLSRLGVRLDGRQGSWRM
jgi:DNA-binding response OmpR family regulator